MIVPPASSFVGRDAELTSLLAVLRDPARDVVVLRGPAGAGKTALAQAALAVIRQEGALVGSGAYSEGWDRAQFGPVMRALSQAAGQALDGLYDPEAGLQVMAQALGPALGVLRRTGFLADAAGDVETVAVPVGRREGAARIVDATVKLVGWLAGFDKPVVLFIDDWWRAATEARDLVLTLAQATSAGGITLLLTEREAGTGDNGKFADDPVVLDIGPLREADRTALFEAMLGQSGEAVAGWFGAQGPMLPFDIRAAATALTASGALVHDHGGWRVDPTRAGAIGQEDLARVLVDRLPALGAKASDLALTVALWGEATPVAGLALAMGETPDDLEQTLEDLRAAGLLRLEAGAASLVHDRLRAPILAARRVTTRILALQVSERLRSAPDDAWPAVADAALNFRRLAGVEKMDPERWRDRFSDGARRARLRSDLDIADGLAEVAWGLREKARPADVEADRGILREAILAAADRGEGEAVLARVRQLFASNHDVVPRGEDYELAVAALRFSGDWRSAWSIGCEGLARLGMRLPAETKARHVALAAVQWRLARLVRRRKPGAGDQGAASLVRIGNAAATLAFEFSPPTAALVAFGGSRRASAGAQTSTFWLATDTFLLASLGDYAAAASVGERAVLELEREGDGGYAYAASLYRALFWGLIWSRPQGSLRAPCQRIRDLAVAEGDIVQAGVAIRNWVLLGWRSGASLAELEGEIEAALRDIARLGARDVASAVEAFLRVVRRLRSPPGARTPSPGPDDPEPITPAELLLALELASVEGDFARGQRLALLNRVATRAFHSHPGIVVWRFHEGLANLKMGTAAPAGSVALVRRAAKLNPTDHRAKLLVLEAEALRRRRGPRACLAAYAEAVSAAALGPSRLEAGLAAECAAAAARAAGETTLARDYDGRAQVIWRAWGALAKLEPDADAPESAAREDQLTLSLAEARGQVSEAERATRARSRFLADVAHELRTPMQGMQALIDLAAGDAAAVDLPSLGRAFASLKTVVDDLTDFGALSSGEAPLTASAAEIADLVRSEALVAEAAARRGGAVVVEIAADVPRFVETDGARVRQVLRNLLSNAAKYGAGSIAVRLSLAAPAPGGGEALEIVVEDDGPGLTPSQMNHLFEPFERGARAGDGTGLGLGLTVSRRVAERLGGGLAGGNRPQGGARFTFTCPLVRGAGPSAVSTPPRLARILLAEDEPLIRDLIARILRREGHEVWEAGDGEQALALRAQHGVDLAIVDLTMPGMGGAELLGRLARAGADGPTASIVLTADGGASAAAEARGAGAALVLRKPVSAAELREAIATVLPDSRGVEAPLASEAAEEMAQLDAAARLELGRRVPLLIARLTSGEAAAPAEAHQIAGLAAQFGWPQIADAADAAEQALKCGVPEPAEAARALTRALTSLTDQASEAVTASR